MPPVLQEALKNYIREVAELERSRELNQHLFLAIGGGSWTYEGVKKLFERANREANVGVHLTCYSFRRFAATELFKK
jgi:integrase